MSNFDNTIAQQIRQKIVMAESILLMAHRRPDGDTLGANLAMYLYLKGLGKNVDVHCIDEVPSNLRFIPYSGSCISSFNSVDYSLFISCDAADNKQTGVSESHPEIFVQRKLDLINIDHHASNTQFGGINCVYPNMASSTQVIYNLLNIFQATISPDIATCLLTGLYTDTGSYQHSNTTAETLRMGADLVRSGADLKTLSKEFFNTIPDGALRLWGKVMARVKTTPEGVAISAVKKKDFQETGATKEDLSGLVDYLKFIPGIQYANLITEESDKVKVSLRTIRDDVDVARIAISHGGGGHIKAAGFTLEGRLEEETKWKIVAPDNREQESF
jgi:bifunctional oligoribonuclease and PAP phosphatase NrnA